MSGGGQGSKPLAEGLGLGEALPNVVPGGVFDYVADGEFEGSEEVLGLVFGGQWVVGARDGIGGGLSIGTIVMLIGDEKLEPGNARLVGGPGGDNHAVEEPGDLGYVMGGGRGLELAKGWLPDVDNVLGDGVRVPSEGCGNIDRGVGGEVLVGCVLIGLSVMLVVPEHVDDEPLDPSDEIGVGGGP